MSISPGVRQYDRWPSSSDYTNAGNSHGPPWNWLLLIQPFLSESRENPLPSSENLTLCLVTGVKLDSLVSNTDQASCLRSNLVKSPFNVHKRVSRMRWQTPKAFIVSTQTLCDNEFDETQRLRFQNTLNRTGEFRAKQVSWPPLSLSTHNLCCIHYST